MAKFISAREAADLIPDGATVAISGMGLSGWAEELGCAVRDRFKETGHPRDLHLKQDSAMGDWAVGQNFIGWDRNRREVTQRAGCQKRAGELLPSPGRHHQSLERDRGWASGPDHQDRAGHFCGP